MELMMMVMIRMRNITSVKGFWVTCSERPDGGLVAGVVVDEETDLGSEDVNGVKDFAHKLIRIIKLKAKVST
jgi:hypothetical protein